MSQIEVFFAIIAAFVIITAGALYFSLVRKREGKAATEALTEEKIVAKAPEIATGLTEVKGIGQKRAEQIKAAGIYSVEDLVRYGSKDLADKVGVSEKITSKWINNAKEVLSRK